MNQHRTDTNPYQAYSDALRQALNGPSELNERTQEYVNIAPTPIIMQFSQPNVVVLPGLRRVGVKSSAAEVAWIISGKRNTDWLKKHTMVWEPFKVADQVVASYGDRLRRNFGIDQLEGAIHVLRNDPSNRRCWISLWDARHDGPWFYPPSQGPDPIKMRPCPVGFSLHNVSGRLNFTVILRSSDAVIGYPHDLITFQLLRDAIASSLRIDSGTFTMVLCHFHIYRKHYAVAAEMVRLNQPAGCFMRCEWDIDDIYKNPDGYVESIVSRVPNVIQPEYKARLEVAI